MWGQLANNEVFKTMKAAQGNDQPTLCLPLTSPGFLRNPDMPSHFPGSVVAGSECLRALLQFSPGPLTLFVSEHHLENTQNELSVFNTLCATPSHVSLHTFAQITQVLQSQPCLALHNLAGPQLSLLAYIRSQFASRILPITCMEYGFSFQSFLLEAVAHLLLIPTYPCDALFCATHVAKQATYNLLEHLSSLLQSHFGFQQIPKFQLVVIPHGVPSDLFLPRERDHTRKLLELPLHKTILLYLGRIDPYSKSDLFPLLQAYRKVWQKHTDKVLLLLVGPVNERYLPHLEAIRHELGLPPQSLQLRTNTAKGCVPLYYAASDVFVSLSDTLQENFGLTPVEAMASGLPVVVTDWAGYRESVLEGETGFRIPTFWGASDECLNLWAPFYDWSIDHFYVGQSVGIDHDKLVKSLMLLVENESLRRQMGERARAHAMAEYSWEGSVKLFWDFWKQLAKEAESLKETQPANYALLQPHYYEIFGCFATHGLNGEEQLFLTQRGLHVLKGREPLGEIQDIPEA